jgi:hypothetical protein
MNSMKENRSAPEGAIERKVKRLIRSSPGPFFEVLVVRGCWAKAAGCLHELKPEAVQKLNRRALDRLYDHEIIAIGTIKLWKFGDDWACGIHELVAGAEKEAIEEVFMRGRSAGYVRVRPVEEIDIAIADILWNVTPRYDILGYEAEESTPKKMEKELESWREASPKTARRVRYGCDRHLNSLIKKPRVRQFKRKKKHPAPHWLHQYQFGQGKWEDVDPGSMAYEIKKSRKAFGAS